jgi:aspartate/methionine/tyrosine aminotransferase
VLGHDYRSFDIYNYRGKKLKEKVESYLVSGKVSSILYSNPNNPSWMCFTEEELQIIGELATKYDTIVIEDLAYIAMDFRKDLSVPGKPPYQSTVAQYTKNYIILMSCSKTFSYAGQRLAIMVISDELFHRNYPDLLRYYASDMFGNAMIFGALYSLSAGGSHSAQFGIAAILKAVNDGDFNIQDAVREYEKKAKIMKQLFIKNGFYIVYDKDIDVPVGDGFYFTIGYPGFSGQELLKELLFYGISAISLDITGSERKDGLRACVSQVYIEQFGLLEERLQLFREHHQVR